VYVEGANGFSQLYGCVRHRRESDAHARRLLFVSAGPLGNHRRVNSNSSKSVRVMKRQGLFHDPSSGLTRANARAGSRGDHPGGYAKSRNTEDYGLDRKTGWIENWTAGIGQDRLAGKPTSSQPGSAAGDSYLRVGTKKRILNVRRAAKSAVT